MLFRTTKIDLALQLFRGERVDKLADVRTRGVHSRAPQIAPTLPNMAQLQFGGLPADLHLALLENEVVKHVRYGSAGSPLISFSFDENAAIRFALDAGRREKGIVISALVRLRQKVECETANGWTVAYRDDRGRTWFPTSKYRSPTGYEVIHAAATRHVRALGSEDRELLLFGSLSAGEIAVRTLARRRAYGWR